MASGSCEIRNESISQAAPRGERECALRGGAFFPVFTPARLAGSSLGGSFLKLRSVHVGFRLELSTDRGFIITSPVRSVSRAAEPTDPNDIM